MTNHAKTLEAMRRNPRDWRIDDLKAVAAHVGVECRNVGGSHHVFGYPGVVHVSVPAHRPIKPPYVRQFVKFIDAVETAKEAQQ